VIEREKRNRAECRRVKQFFAFLAFFIFFFCLLAWIFQSSFDSISWKQCIKSSRWCVRVQRAQGVAQIFFSFFFAFHYVVTCVHAWLKKTIWYTQTFDLILAFAAAGFSVPDARERKGNNKDTCTFIFITHRRQSDSHTSNPTNNSLLFLDVQKSSGYRLVISCASYSK